MKELENMIKNKYNKAKDKIEFLNEVKQFLQGLSIVGHNPVDFVRWVDYKKVKANEYNPNIVATNEMQLLYVSIKNDNYTQPIVTVYDKEKDEYVIVDGFHRCAVLLHNKDIMKLNHGLLPIVVIEKDIKDRMASTIRHNRARGKHHIEGMGRLVFRMLEEGWTDMDICKELGMESEELIKLKHITGFSKLFENVDYRKAWKTKRQVQVEKKWREEHGTV